MDYHLFRNQLLTPLSKQCCRYEELIKCHLLNFIPLDVYAQKKVVGVDSSKLDSLVKAQKEILVFTDNVGLEELKTSKNTCKILKSMSDYPVTLLSLNFANPSKRESVLGKRYLIKVTE